MNLPTTFKRAARLLAVLLVSLPQGASEVIASTPATVKNYAYLYFENGYPTRLNYRRPQSEANLAARANPDLVFQTGYYSVLLDCNDIELNGYDALTGSDYFTALNEDVASFTPASSFILRVTQGGVDYTCEGAVVQGNNMDNVRLIESGQYVKRIDHMGLVFRDADGNELVLDEACRLEITAWPDRITFLLDSSSETTNPITRSTIQVVSPAGVSHVADAMSNQARLTLKPQEDAKLGTLVSGDYVTQATNLQNYSALSVSFDADTHAHVIEVPANAVRYPSGENRVDEYLIEVVNPGSAPANIPLRFIQPSPRAITGTVMFLSDADSGRPLGIPVQISKNWHGNAANVHEGTWLRGSTMLTLDAGESRRLKLRVVYGYWGGAGTVSHSQLSLIGWGKGNWKWDESALGAWGESLTLDPTQHLGAAFLDDIRPAFTQSFSNTGAYKDGGTVNTTHDWTENVGGGDFLIYRDSANTYRWLKRVKTCYYQTGPNLTEVHYSGVTDDNKIRVNYTSRMVATRDYHRRFHAYQYNFLENVTNPRRLVFYQMAADYYSFPIYSNFHVGDTTGLLTTVDINDPGNPIAGGNSYKGDSILMDGKWLSIDDTSGQSSNAAQALRGLIPLSSTLNGNAFPLHVHKYGRTYTSSTVLFDFSSDAVNRSYSAGDVVAGEIEFIMPPQHRDHYWGSDAELIGRLNGYGDATWQPVRDELVENIGMSVSIHQGTLLRNYPLEIQSTSGSRVLADLTINSGGIGHVPLLLKGADANLGLRVQRFSSGAWVDLESVDIGNDTYYQSVQNADGTMDYAFSIPRPVGLVDLDASWRLRVIYADFPRLDTPLVETLNLSSANGSENDSRLRFGDTKFTKRSDSAWSVTSGTLSNNSSINSRVSEGALGSIIDVNSLSVSQGNLVTLSFDYSMGDPAEVLYVHLWGLVGSSNDGSMIMNLGSSNGTASYYSNAGVDMYNLADGVATGGGASEAAIALTGKSGMQSHSATFDLSGFSVAANDLSDFDYLVLGFARKIDGASTPGVEISNIVLSVNTKGEDEQPYEKWASDLGLAQAGAGDDPDSDGMSNFREFALGGNPSQVSSTGTPPFQRVVNDAGTQFLEYVYRRRIGSDNVLNYRLQTSTDLSTGSWTNNGFVELPAVATEDPNFEEVSGRVNMGNAPKTFMRLVIETP